MYLVTLAPGEGGLWVLSCLAVCCVDITCDVFLDVDINICVVCLMYYCWENEPSLPPIVCYHIVLLVQYNFNCGEAITFGALLYTMLDIHGPSVHNVSPYNKGVFRCFCVKHKLPMLHCSEGVCPHV